MAEELAGLPEQDVFLTELLLQEFLGLDRLIKSGIVDENSYECRCDYFINNQSPQCCRLQMLIK